MANLASEVQIIEEQPTVRRIAATAVLRCAGEGVTERGPLGSTGPYASYSEWSKVYGGYTALSLESVAAVVGFFDNGGTQLYWSRVVHTTTVGDPTTKTSVAGTLNLLTAAASPSAGFAQSVAQPFNLEPGDDLDIAIDGGAPVTATFSATAASRVTANAEPFTLANGQTLQIAVNGGATFTKTFATAEFASIAAATAEEVVATLNAFFAANELPAVASGTTTVTITTNRRGTGAIVNIVGGTAVGASPLLQFTTGALAGTGNVANIDAVTAAEAAGLIQTAVGATAVVTTPSGTVLITSATTGPASSVQVQASSTADDEFGFDNATHSGLSGAAVNTLLVTAKTDGTYAGDVRLVVAAATDGNADRFNFYVEVKGVIAERWFNASMLDADAAYIETLVNDATTGSDYVTVSDLDVQGVGGTAAQQRPASGTFGPLTGGGDGLVGLADSDFTGGETVNGSTGFRTFDDKAIDVLIVPGRATSAVHNGMITYCEITRAGLVFAVMDPPANQTAAQIVAYVETTASLLESSEYAAIYWPRVKVANPDRALFGTDATVVVPPSGHLAGIYARNDARKVGGAFEQPAGIEFGVPRSVLGLEMDEVRKKAKRELVFPKNVNPISKEDGTPIFVDGARTLKGTGNWGSVGQRRGVIFVEQRLIPGLAFMRHRNIKDKLYKEGERAVTLFLLELTRNDAFKSTDPKKAFFVDFGPGLNPPSVQAQKKIVARIGLATSEPAEFVVLLVGPDTRALDEELAALAA
jgi:hypothetical protein